MRELFIEKSRMSVAPTTSSWSIIVDASFFLTSAETATATATGVKTNAVITTVYINIVMSTNMEIIIGTVDYA